MKLHFGKGFTKQFNEDDDKDYPLAGTALSRKKPMNNNPTELVYKPANIEAFAKAIYNSQAEYVGANHEEHCIKILVTALQSYEDEIKNCKQHYETKVREEIIGLGMFEARKFEGIGYQSTMIECDLCLKATAEIFK